MENIAKYNFWHGNMLDIGYERSYYLNVLKSSLGNRLVKVIVGQRRIGKSYIMRQVIYWLINNRQVPVAPENTLYINKELGEYDGIKTHSDLLTFIESYKKQHKVKGKVYVFIDEVQEIESWEKAINSLTQNPKDEYEIFVTGSNSNLLSSDLSTYLSGRYLEVAVYGFSYAEYVGFYKLPRNKESYLRYLNDGGLPELLHLDQTVKSNYISSVKDTVLLKDIVKRYSVNNVSLLDNLFRYLSKTAGTEFSLNSIYNEILKTNKNVSYETVVNYVNYLKHSYLIHEVERYDLVGKKVFGTTKKYYLNDLAFANYLNSDYDPMLGRKLENSMFLELKRQNNSLYVGSISGLEVDFIAQNNTAKNYYQIAYLLADENVIAREFGSLLKIPDNYPKAVITLDDTSFASQNGIQHKLAWEI